MSIFGMVIVFTFQICIPLVGFTASFSKGPQLYESWHEFPIDLFCIKMCPVWTQKMAPWAKIWRPSMSELSVYRDSHHHSTNSSWLPQTSRNRLVNIDKPHVTRYDLIFSLTFGSRLTRDTYISNNNSVVFYWGLLKRPNSRPTCPVFC